MAHRELPIPPHFDPEKVGELWRVPYQEKAEEADTWATQQHITPAARDEYKICLVAVDVQNTFCIPGFELFVAGRSGKGAVEDNQRLCQFIYRNLDIITQITPTMDTHQPMQVFHAVSIVDKNGEHPAPFTLISEEDVKEGRWRLNPELCHTIQIDEDYGQQYLLHYTRALKRGGKYDLTIWPYHAMLGGIGHALVSSVEEAIFFHSMVRHCQANFQIKGDNPLTEHYSVLGPEVLDAPDGSRIAERNAGLIAHLLRFDAVIITGQAKSHCVAWTIDDLLEDIHVQPDTRLAEKVYLLEDCTSPVVVPGVLDYTDQADAAFQRFADAGMHIVRSVDPIDSWPGIKL